MATFEDSIAVRATPLDCYELTQDYSRRLEWDPFLREARLVGGALRVQPGARAWCVATNGMGMETEYVSAQPGRVAAVFMTRGPWVLEHFAGAWLFHAGDEGETRVTFRYHIRVRPRPLRFLVQPVVLFWFRREMRQRLAALKAALERDCR